FFHQKLDGVLLQLSRQLFAQPFYRLFKIHGTDGLEQVMDGGMLERFQGIVIICRNEDQLEAMPRELFQDIEPRTVRDTNINKDNPGPEGFDQPDGAIDIPGMAAYPELGSKSVDQALQYAYTF